MITESTSTPQTLPPLGIKNDDLAVFLIQYMNYSKEDVQEALKDDFEQTKELAIKIKESILNDKSISPEYKAKLKKLEF
jgi:hypothetical protein